MVSDECNQEYEFPIKIYNRPGLDHIQYRIGKYSQFKRYLLRKLDRSEALNAWTHRSPDDPAFALLEGACILGDILTFYQELYANEAYIRTAREKESIADLVRLVGYNLSPGLGGTAIFIVEVKGDVPITLPSDLPIKAEIEGMDQPVIFETKEESVCYPELNRFHLYAPQIDVQISGDTKEFYIDNNSTTDPLQQLEIKSGDRMLIGKLASRNTTEISDMETIIIDTVRRILDKIIFTIKGKLKFAHTSYSIIGYLIKNVYRHFGCNALVSETHNHNFIENIGVTGDDKEFPLDTEVLDLSVGSNLLLSGFFTSPSNGESKTEELHLIRVVEDIRLGNYLYHDDEYSTISGTTSIIRLNAEIPVIDNTIFSEYDIRLVQFYEAAEAQLTIKAMGTLPNPKGSKFNYYGISADTADKLKGRTLTIVTKNNEPINATVIDIDTVSNSLQIDKELDYNDFPMENPTSEIFGNLVVANQGENQSETLDAGDEREEFQTLKLSKSILTYFNSVKETPPEVPELNVYVNNQLWKRVPSFFDRKPDDQIYIVRQDENENSWVQFGDGKTGSRLPSGLGNVLAKYRIGIGASGGLKSETTIKALEKGDLIEKIHLYDRVSGGTKSENGMKAKETAPSKILSLGRLVSLSDYESEALSVPGVIKTSANLIVSCEVPEIVINVLTDNAGKNIPGEVSRILHGYDRCRGMQRYPIDIRLGKFQYIYLELDYGLDPRSLKEVVEKEIGAALGVFREEQEQQQQDQDSIGLFVVKQRKFRQDEYASTVAGVVQNVSGVIWARVKAMYSMGTAEDPEDLIPLDPPRLETTVICEESVADGSSSVCQKHVPHVLRLYHKHLKLNDVSVKNVREC